MVTTGQTVLEERTMEAIQKMARDISAIKENTPTLRDQFAMSAMASFISDGWNGTPMNIRDSRLLVEDMAVAAYKVADAMLKERG